MQIGFRGGVGAGRILRKKKCIKLKVAQRREKVRFKGRPCDCFLFLLGLFIGFPRQGLNIALL